MKKFPGIPSTYGKCATCLHLDSRKCWMCNEKYLEKDMVFLTDNQGYVCKTCFDSNSIKCKQCGKEIINGLRNQIEVDYCNACASERAYVTKIEKLLNNDDVQVKYVTRTAFKNSYAPALMSRLHPAQKVNWGGDDKDSPIDILVIYSWDVGIVVISANSIPWKYIRDDKHKYTVSELKKDKNWRSIQYFNKEVLKSYEWNSQGNSDWDNSCLCIWKHPIKLSGMTYYDMDYRKEWRYGELIYEGNNFGDTSDFLIIGLIRRDI